MTAVTCPSPERWKAHLHGTLPAAEEAELAAHLDGCTACQRFLETLTSDGDSLLDVARAVGAEPQTQETALKEAMGALRDETAGTQTTGWPAGETPADLAFLDPPAQAGHLGRLGRYDVLEVVGRGGMGLVLKAFDEKLNRVVAIKVLGSHYAASEHARKRFEREARAAAAVSHEHIVPIYHVDEHRGVVYLVMPLIAGKSLHERLAASGALELKEVLRIGAEIACGLAAAHKENLVHRDIKPATILLEGEKERVKITDFGLARAVDDASLSQSGVVAGTPLYMSPEQARGESTLDARSDLFSLGSVLYAMATGQPPFQASGSMAVLKRVCDEAPPPLCQVNPDMPKWLEAIVARLHAKRPQDRFQSAGEVAELLGQHLAHLQQPERVPKPPPVQPPPVSLAAPPPARRSHSLVIVLVLGGVLCLGLCVLSVPAVVLLGGAMSWVTLRSDAPGDAGPLAADNEPMATIGPARMEHDQAKVGKFQRFDWGDAFDPQGDCRFEEGPGRFIIRVPAGSHELFPGQNNNFDAPRLLRAADPDGDFSAVVKVQPFELRGEALLGVEKSPYQGAGLLVWHDSKNFIRFLIARTNALDPGPIEHTFMFEGGNTKIERITPLGGRQCYLNLERQGRSFRIRWGTDGKQWGNFATLPEVDYPRKLRVGLVALNISTQEFAPQFEEYRVEPLPGEDVLKKIGKKVGPK
jgi:serine/threonine-protein kinase